ncbi:MAG: glutathione S-transferase family protein [Pseudomonadota bacterium]
MSVPLLLLILILILLLIWWIENRRRTGHPVTPGYRDDIIIPNTDEYELYHNSVSLCSMKVRVCMAELGVPYKSHHIGMAETGRPDTIRPAFRKINPARTVPVLVHNGHPIYESHEQIRYIGNRVTPGSERLVPDSEAARKEMDYWIDRSSITTDPLNNMDKSAGNAAPGQTLPLIVGVTGKVSFLTILELLLFHPIKVFPIMSLIVKASGFNVFKGGAIKKGFLESRKYMHLHFDALEAQLKKTGGPWILGDAYSLADISWMVIFDRLLQCDSLAQFAGADRRAQCAAYWERLRVRPAYQEGVVDYEHRVVAYGRERIKKIKEDNPQIRAILNGD